MATKAQHCDAYWASPPFLRPLRETAKRTQRDLSDKIVKPQSWVYDCETGNRWVDVTEFIAWAGGCGIEPKTAFGRFLGLVWPALTAVAEAIKLQLRLAVCWSVWRRPTSSRR